MGRRTSGRGGRWALAVVVALLAGSTGACVVGDDDGQGDGPGGAGPASPAGAGGETAAVVEVIDGDTVDVRLDAGGGEERVRLIGINTPERGECFYDEATDALDELLADGEVVLVADVSDRDQHGRLLRYVEVDGEDVNERLVRLGVARSRSYPPDTARQARLDAAQDEAMAAGAGLWATAACGAAAPDAAAVEVVGVVADPPGSDEDDPNAETATVANRGATAVDLGGWVLKDTSASHRFTFPSGFVLAAGAEVVVHTGCGTDTATDLHWCNQGSLVWNNDGDTAFLEDPAGNTVSTLEV